MHQKIVHDSASDAEKPSALPSAQLAPQSSTHFFLDNSKETASSWYYGNILMRIAVAFAMGTIFGFVLDRSNVMLPSVIRMQMIFTAEFMMKMWCAALATSAVFQVFFFIFAREKFERVRSRPYGDKGIFTLAAAGLLQGIGMTLTGACPGMVLGQIGSSIPNAVYTWIGGLIGAILYNLIHPFISDAMTRDFAYTFGKISPSISNIDKLFTSQYAFPTITLLLAIVVGIVVLVFELVFPWGTDGYGVVGGRTLADGLLNPTAAGVAVGSLQLPGFIFLSAFLGTSASYSVIVSQPMRVAPAGVQKEFAYAKRYSTSMLIVYIVYVVQQRSHI